MASLLLVIFFAAIPASVRSAIYAITPGLDIVTSSRVYITNESPAGTYYLASNGSMDIVSENGTFALVVVELNDRILALVMKNNDSQAFFLDIISTYNVASIYLDECGNIVVHDIYGIEQFEALSSILPPMCTSQGLSSSTYFGNSDSVDFNYSATVYDGGLALALNEQMYGAWSFKDLKTEGSANDFRTSRCAGHIAYMVMARNGSLALWYGKRSDYSSLVNDCLIQPLMLPFRKLRHQDGELVLPFLKLTESGDLGLYTMDTKQQRWVADSVLVLDMICKSVLSCGVDSVCDLDGKCNSSLAVGDTSHGPRDLKYARLHGLAWTRNGVGYISTRFLEYYYQDLVSLDECRVGHVKYRATFYDHSTGLCYFMYKLPVGSLHRDDNMTAFLNFDSNSFDPLHNVKIVVRRIGIVIAGTFLILVTLAIILLPLAKGKVENTAKEVENLLSTMQGLPQRFSYMELEAATRGFTTKLGAGGFGSVYEGFTKDERHVAVKKLDDNGTESAKQFVTEIAGIGGVSHYNIVKLCGFCIDGATQKLLVYEFMPNGSLDRWLFGNDSKRTLTWEQRFSVALGTARGLFYLHEECSEPILHLDIKPQNILLDGKFEAKVADFGMAKLLANREVTHVETNVRGTPGYMAPEWLLQYAATKKCDIYSYGMLLLELIGGRKNVDFLKISCDDTSWYFPAWVVDKVKENKLLEVVDQRVQGLAPKDEVTVMVRIALWCIQDNPTTRPSMGEILEMLNGHRQVNEPPMSFYFDHREDSHGISLLKSQSLFCTP